MQEKWKKQLKNWEKYCKKVYLSQTTIPTKIENQVFFVQR